jgi:hypothetical protein
MKIDDVFILEEAVDDLSEGKAFYDFQETGVGDYYWDCLIADIESLVLYGGIHSKKFDLFQMFSKRFPYAIYYEVVENVAYVVAVLPMRRNPVWVQNKINQRH